MRCWRARSRSISRAGRSSQDRTASTIGRYRDKHQPFTNCRESAVLIHRVEPEAGFEPATCRLRISDPPFCVVSARGARSCFRRSAGLLRRPHHTFVPAGGAASVSRRDHSVTRYLRVQERRESAYAPSRRGRLLKRGVTVGAELAGERRSRAPPRAVTRRDESHSPPASISATTRCDRSTNPIPTDFASIIRTATATASSSPIELRWIAAMRVTSIQRQGCSCSPQQRFATGGSAASRVAGTALTSTDQRPSAGASSSTGRSAARVQRRRRGGDRKCRSVSVR